MTVWKLEKTKTFASIVSILSKMPTPNHTEISGNAGNGIGFGWISTSSRNFDFCRIGVSFRQ